MPEQPLVSVIVPSYNQGKFIRATLDSILQQDYRPIEILVMDGGSTDETVEVLKSYGELSELKWVSEPDRGVVDAVNKGFAKTQGEILAIQSSDDCYLPGTLYRVVEEFSCDTAAGFVYGDTVKIDAEGREVLRNRIGPYSLEALFLRKTWIPQPSAFFRREVLEAVGGWDSRIPYCPDTDMWIRMAFHTKVVKIDEYLSALRSHEAQRDTCIGKIVRDYGRMIDRLAEIQEAPPELQRAAHASKYLMRLRYNPYGSELYAGWSLLRAGWICPACRDTRGARDCFSGNRSAASLRDSRKLSWAVGLEPRRGCQSD